jgi:hypothetical protein
VIDATPRKLPAADQAGRRTGIAFLGWKGLLFGLPFAGTGAFVALWVAPRQHGRGDAPAGVVQGIGALFFVAGAWFVLGVLLSWWRGWRRGRRLARHRSDPWRADHAWDPRGVAGDLGRRAARAFLASAGMAAFLALFNAIAFLHLDPLRQGNGVWFMRSVVVLLDVAVCASFAWSFYLLLRRLKYGTTFLHFGRFPFLLGETADVRVAAPDRSRGVGELSATLRCVEERIERVKRGGRTTIYVARWQLWADERKVAAGALSAGGLSLSFGLPADPRLGTELSAPYPRYWELAVKGEAPGVDFASTFLVPVYAMPGSVPLAG